MIEKFSTEKLLWSKETKTLIGNVSEVLDSGLLTFNMVSVKSQYTGQVKVFELVDEDKNFDGSVRYWKFESRATPEIKLVLWNK